MNKEFKSIENVGRKLNNIEVKKVVGGKNNGNSLVFGSVAIKRIRSLFKKH